jgi:hypothetical protein
VSFLFIRSRMQATDYYILELKGLLSFLGSMACFLLRKRKRKHRKGHRAETGITALISTTPRVLQDAKFPKRLQWEMTPIYLWHPTWIYVWNIVLLHILACYTSNMYLRSEGTNYFHGAEPFRTGQLCSYSRTSQKFKEREVSLPCLQEPSLVSILSHINLVHTTLSYLSILILSTNLRLGLPSGFFPSGFLTYILYTFLFASIRALIQRSM